jgi:hypothetical protein
MKSLEISKAAQFVSLLSDAKEGLAKAGKFAAEQIDANPNFIDEVLKLAPQLTEEFIRRFERIGRGQMVPQLMWDASPGVGKLIKMPVSLQEKYLNEPVALLVKSDAGWETLKCDVRNLSASQASQVFNGEGVRSEAAQRAWIEDKRAKLDQKIPTATKEPYRVVRHSLVIVEPVTISRAELLMLLAKMDE